jgi:hypothetical protein
MTPKNFDEVNVVFAKDQPEYIPLPAFLNEAPTGEVITCWRLSFRERIRLLFTGEIWLCMLTFHRPLTPTFVTTKKTELLSNKIE